MGGLGPPPPGAMPDVLPPSGEASRDVVMHDDSLGRCQNRCAPYVPSLASHLAYLPPGAYLSKYHAPPSPALPFLGQVERHAYRGLASISCCIDDAHVGTSLPGSWPGTGGSAWGAPPHAYVAMTWTGASSTTTPSASCGRNVPSAGWKPRARWGGNSEPRPSLCLSWRPNVDIPIGSGNAHTCMGCVKILIRAVVARDLFQMRMGILLDVQHC